MNVWLIDIFEARKDADVGPLCSSHDRSGRSVIDEECVFVAETTSTV